MNRNCRIYRVGVAVFTSAILALAFALPASAAFTVGGDAGEVFPANPATWTDELYVGWHSGKTGTLSVDGGSDLQSGYAYVGDDFGSTGTITVTGSGSTWTGTWTKIGYDGAGTLNVENGGRVESGNTYVGYGVGSIGTATVSGADSYWSAPDLRVGYYGVGTTTVKGGGELSASNVWLGNGSNANGSITVTDSGSYAWLGALFLGSRVGTGTVRVANGGVVASGAIYGSLSDLQGDGTIRATGMVIDGNLTFNAQSGPRPVLSFGTGGVLNMDASDYKGRLGAGYRGTGTTTVSGGVTVKSKTGLIGCESGSNGTLLVTGTSSTWDNQYDLYVGVSGTSTLTIAAGGKLNNPYASSSTTGCIASDPGSTGTVNVTGAGSTWTNGGWVSVGRKGNGKLIVDSGGKVSSVAGFVGSLTGSTGTVIVKGQGSTWTNSSSLSVGGSSTGTLTVESGGQVSSSYGFIGDGSYSNGTATVSGAGSIWTNSGSLAVGNNGTGKLTVADGGKVTAGLGLSIKSNSAINLRVSGSGILLLGDASTTGSVSNSGKINLYADAFLAAGTYSPITEFAGRTITRTGTGSYNATGGTWDSNAYNFPVLPATRLNAQASDNVTTGERLLITDGATNRRVGASFGTVGSGVNFSAKLMDESILSGLPLEDDESVRSAWDFTTNFTGGNALLAFEIGQGVNEAYLRTWHYSGDKWISIEPGDLIYDSRGILSFTAGDFGDYAISEIPEPATLGLLALGALAMIRRRRAR